MKYERPKNSMNLEEALEYVAVWDPGMWENENTPLLGNWYAVGDDDNGIIAYFANESEAYRFRLAYINRLLNG